MSNPADFIIENNSLKKYIGPGGEVVIPEGITAIQDNAFSEKYCTANSKRRIQRVICPDSVKEIGKAAFNNCSQLQEIRLSPELKTIGDNAFFSCTQLRSIVIPQETSIGRGTFKGCAKLADGQGWIIVNRALFDYFGDSNQVNIPEEVAVISTNAFEAFSNIENISIPESVIQIEERAFRNCRALKKVVIAEGLEVIGEHAFEGCKITAISFPTSLRNIGSYAFWACPLRQVVIPDGVTTIGDLAFYQCEKLKTVSVPDSITRMGDSIFEDCASIQSFIVSENNKTVLKANLFGEHYPEGLLPSIDVFADTLSNPCLKNSILKKEVWASFGLATQANIFTSYHNKGLLPSYLKCIQGTHVELLAKEFLRRVLEEPTVKECNAAASYLILFSGKLSDDILKATYGGLQATLYGQKAVKQIEGDNLLWNRLQSDKIEGKSTVERILIDILEKEKTSLTQMEMQLKETYGLKRKELPPLTDIEVPEVSSMVLTWLLIRNDEDLEYMGSKKKHDAVLKDTSAIIERLDQKSFQNAMMELANLVSQLNGWSKKGEVLIPVCRFANEQTMTEIVQHAGKWGRHAKQYLIKACIFSDTRAAMLFAERNGCFEEYASMRGVDADYLRDTVLAYFGLEDGKKTYDLGGKLVTVSLNDDLTLSIFDHDTGKYTKSIPKRNSDEEKFEAAKTDFADLSKNIKKVVRARNERLFQDFLERKQFNAGEWKEVYLKNAVLNMVGRLLIWKQKNHFFTLSADGAVGADGSEYAISDDAIILAHPMEMKKKDIEVWQKYFVTHGLKQPFTQIWEPVIAPEMIERDRYKGCRLSVYKFSGKEKHGIKSYGLYDWSSNYGFKLTDCELSFFDSGERFYHDMKEPPEYTLGEFQFKIYNRKVNHIVSILDKMTVEERIKKDDLSSTERLEGFTLAQVSEFIKLAQENNALNVLAQLLDYKNAHFAEFDPMDEFTLDLL